MTRPCRDRRPTHDIPEGARGDDLPIGLEGQPGDLLVVPEVDDDNAAVSEWGVERAVGVEAGEEGVVVTVLATGDASDQDLSVGLNEDVAGVHRTDRNGDERFAPVPESGVEGAGREQSAWLQPLGPCMVATGCSGRARAAAAAARELERGHRTSC